MATSEEVGELGLLAQSTRSIDRINNELLLELSLRVINFPATKGSKNRLSFADLTLRDKVTRGVRKVDHSDNDNDTEDDLESNGETPHQVVGTEVSTKVDPVGDSGTDGNDTTLNTDQQTTIASLGALGLIRRDGRGVHAVSNTGDNTSEEELKKRDLVRHGGNLNDHTNNHDRGARNDHPATTGAVTEDESEDGTNKTP